MAEPTKLTCDSADEAFNALVKSSVPTWTPDGSMYLRKLAGPFLEIDAPLGHAVSHLASYMGSNIWLPLLHLPPATYNFVRTRLLDTYRTGIAIGRIYELSRQGLTVSEEEAAKLLEKPKDLFGKDFDDEDD